MEGVIKKTVYDGAYLFVHFVGENDADEEQMYFSVSRDGEEWTTLNSGKPVLKSNVGENGIRDPYILRCEDGKFVIVATDLSIYSRNGDWSECQTAGSKSIVVWKSDDLVNWSAPKLIKVAPDGAGCTWAPEVIYDKTKGKYMVFWASKTSDDGYTKQRIYRSYTSDFKTFETPEVYIDKDKSMIDTTIIENDGVYYRFTKNEDEKYVFMESSSSLDGPWSEVSGYNHKETGFEGPTIYKLNGQNKWCLMLDNYGNGGYKPFVTDDLASGVFESAGNITFDGTYRHGTVMPITTEEYKALLAKQW